MGFFLLGKRRDTGALRLISEELYSTRQEAIDALAEIDVPAELESEVHAADLDAATPVVVVQKRPASEPVGDEAIAQAIVEDAEEAAGAASEPEAEPADGHPAPEAREPEYADEDEDAGLHDALKGAAITLEDEGIVAPDSVGPAPAKDESWPWDAEKADKGATDESDQEAELDQAIAAVGVSRSADEAAPEEALEPEPTAVEVSAVADEPAEDVVETRPEYVPDPLEEPAVAVGDMVSHPDSEDASTGHPVIMGEYDERPSTPDEPPSGPEFEEIAPEPANTKARDDLESVLADLEISDEQTTAPDVAVFEEPDVTGLEIPAEMAAEIPAAPVAEPADTPTAEEPAEQRDESSADLLASVAEADEPSQETGFEAGGSDLADLTCDDCVYMNTCPKQGESDPSTCGSFQWRSS
jgi:hypothetical protein